MTCSGRLAVSPVNSSTARRMPRNAVSSALASRAPSGVSSIRRPPRTTSVAPSRSSSARTCWLTAAWLTLSAAPAAVKPPVSARAEKARSAPSEGSVRQSML